MAVKRKAPHKKLNCHQGPRLCEALKGCDTPRIAEAALYRLYGIAVDALLFFDVKGGESISRKALVADRIRLCEQGHWGTLWAHAEMQTMPMNQDDTDELERSATIVNKLIEARGSPRQVHQYGATLPEHPPRKWKTSSEAPIIPQMKTCPSSPESI